VPGENIVAIVGENLSPDIWYVYFKMYIEQSDLSGIADIAQNNTVNVYPNPVRGNLLAEINNAGSDGSAYIEVLDMSGRTLLAKDINGLSQGRNTYSLSVSDLSAGAYLIRVTIGGISVFNRFEVIGSH
jgi:hypothetical protein